jgi:hypothetical protein
MLSSHLRLCASRGLFPCGFQLSRIIPSALLIFRINFWKKQIASIFGEIPCVVSGRHNVTECWHAFMYSDSNFRFSCWTVHVLHSTSIVTVAFLQNKYSCSIRLIMFSFVTGEWLPKSAARCHCDQLFESRRWVFLSLVLNSSDFLGDCVSA